MGGFEGRQVVGYQNEAELAEKLGTLSYVCKSDDVLDLPEYHHVEHYCELEPKARRIYERLDKEFVAGVDDGTITAGNALVKLLRLQQLTGGWLRDDEDTLHRVSTAKEELFADWLEDMPVHEPLAIFARFHTDLDAVQTAGAAQSRKVGELSGRITERDPQYALNGADMRDDIDVAAVQLQAGGVGIDLTRAAHAGYYSMGYSLGDYEQSLKRTHRHGQTRPVTYHHFIVRNTKDEAVYEALRERKSVVEAMISASRRPR
jgi:SNF2 family DNA or RNA helicase